MNIPLALAVNLASVTVLTYILLIIFWRINIKSIFQALPDFPPIAVLVAARNEEKHLAQCIDALLALNYPPEKVQIWIGNDGSSDKTGEVACRYAQQMERVEVIDIHEKMGQADAKANVLAHLIRASATARPSAKYLLITDADVQVNPDWAMGMLQHAGIGSHAQNTGVVTGVTLIRGNSVWARLQCIDWLLGLGMVKVASEFGKPVTTLGNNMMVSREAYEATGGYESMPFSITEDYALLHNTFRRGFGFRNVLDASVLAESLPIASVKELLQQRVRWMHGAMQLPKLLVMLLFIIAFFYPLLFYIAFSKPWMALGLFFLKMCAESMFAGMMMQQLNLGLPRKKKLFATLLLYEFYAAALSISMIILYFLPMKVRWKGRIFQ